MEVKTRDILIHVFLSWIVSLYAIASMQAVIDTPLMSHDEKLLIIGSLYGVCLGLLGSYVIVAFWQFMTGVVIILNKRGR